MVATGSCRSEKEPDKIKPQPYDQVYALLPLMEIPLPSASMARISMERNCLLPAVFFHNYTPCHFTASIVISSLCGEFPINENRSVLSVSKKATAEPSKPLLIIFSNLARV